jgi:glycolate oxidase FAD binding subunit
VPDTIALPPAPLDEAEIASVIAEANAARMPVWVCGNESKAASMRPVQAGRTVSTRNLAGITLYSPTELILSARAGTPVSEIEAVLGARGQHMIAEPPDFSQLFGSTQPATIGGIVAANLSGPRRIAWGATRDHVMGLRAVNGTGEVLRCGGRVLKNVTGLDLCKLLTGSHGTLGVITEVTIKVLPAPERRATLVIPGLDPVRGVAALSAALGSPYGVSGAAYLPAEAAAQVPALSWIGQSATLVRLEDFASSVLYRSDRLRTDLAAYGMAEILDEGATRAAWARVRDAVPLAAAPEQAIWRVSVRPSAGPAVAAACAALGASWFMDWGGGLVWIAGPATEAAHAAIRRAATEARGTWMLFRAPDSLRLAVDIIPPESPTLARIGARVQAAFDPNGILNPGRLRAAPRSDR